MILERVWIFGSGKGETYGDNSRALFEYVTKNEPSIRAIWLTKRKDISLHVRKLGGISYHYYSLPGIFYALTARVIVVCNSFLDVSFLAFAFPRRKLIVQLWHGTPLKKLESMHWPKLKGLAMNTFLGYLGRDCDMVFSATDLNIDIYKKCFRVNAEQIHITGQPRNDYLFKPQGIKGRQLWYIPTFREYDHNFNFFEGHKFDSKKLNALLAGKDTTLFIKLHDVDRGKMASYSNIFKNLSSIQIANPSNLYEELASFISISCY
jgi:CDP-glycerol glycerophosphotransferase (TagB/SpsB family)